MGIDLNFPLAFAKSQIEAGLPLPLSGKVFISVKDADKPKIVSAARILAEAGFTILATVGTAERLAASGVPAQKVPRLAEGLRPNILDYIKSRDVGLLINTPSGPVPRQDEITMRAAAVTHSVPLITTVPAANAAAAAIRALKHGQLQVHSLQEIHGGPTAALAAQATGKAR
jgi:carbamoyl-phosphate synthase large subunit